ncbi:hypothetical protein RDWZM_000866 [Blomia tropicalis]|uniref:SGNH hydrolase-type esterase domain-containing protein n=1 Tax=Blomia tropicalis TaxID=40697 RepID=A0A9Q0RQ29_BLOTA|nr:hypothetical protein RDWZM_000866 [Blomia tropicalis]
MNFFTVLATITLIGLAQAGSPWIAEPRNLDWWKARHQGLLNQTKLHAAEEKVIFLGDSITEGWSNHGKNVWKQHYENRHSFNYGIGGDRTEHILWRIANGELENVNAKLVVLMIGTNNIRLHSSKDIAKGIHAILDALYSKMPNAKVLLLSVLPRQPENIDSIVHDINKSISQYADNKRVFWLDLTTNFEVTLGLEKAELFLPDHVHLTEKGYQMWQKVMEPTFSKLIA